MNKYKNFTILSISGLATLLLLSFTASIFIIKKHDNKEYQTHYTSLYDIKSKIKNQDNDIIFLGDSSLLNGLNTIYFQKLSKRKSYNLALYANSAPPTYKILIDNYLKNNSKPKLVIIYFAASAPYCYIDSHFEKTYSLVKDANIKEIINNLYPIDIILTAKTILAIYAKKLILNHNFKYEEFKKSLQEKKGFDPNMKSALKENQEISSIQKKVLHIKSLIELQSYIRSMGIKTILYAAPITKSDKGYNYFRKFYSKITFIAIP